MASLVASASENSTVPSQMCENALVCAQNSVVSILPVWPPNASRSQEPEGSGVVVGDGTLIATADHVIGAAKKVLVRTKSGEVFKVEIALRDALSDIALLRSPRPMRSFKLAETVVVGDRACAVGNSFGLDVSVTCGVVSARQMSGVGFNRIEDFIQTDAAVNPGMSGGALVNEEGALIGMLSAIFTKKSDSNIGVNFAVSSPLLKRVVEDFLEDGKLERYAPGIVVSPSVKAGEIGISGALVVAVKAGSPEETAGVQKGDIILSAGGRRIKRAGAYLAALALVGKKNNLEIQIVRGEKPRSITIKFD